MSKTKKDEQQKEKKQQTPATQIGLHSVKNILGNERQLSLFSEHKPKEFAKTYGIEIEQEISKFGIDLTDIQQRIMEAILYGFSQTRYEGNVRPQVKEEHAKEKYPSGKIPSTYKYVNKLPRLRVTQSELLKWSGTSKEGQAGKERTVKALSHLATHQYCFYYTRLALDEDGNPIKDKEGGWKKEEVMGIDTLFTIKEVRDKRKVLQYYEITPSTLFLDQRESYFMLIPYNWREEVRKLVGQRKASSYTFRFLLFLRYQFELNRRSPKQKKPYVIRWSPEEIATVIKMPQSIYRRKKSRANKILEETYTVAKQLGYLTTFERTNTVDILHLNEEKYYMPKNQEKLFFSGDEEDRSPEMQKAKELLDFFIQEKRKVIPTYNPPGGGDVRKASLRYLVLVINQHSFELAKQVISWGIKKPFWCNRIGTPSKLHKHFNEAIAEMNVAVKTSKKQDLNKTFSIQFAKEFKSQKSKIKIEAFNKYIEIGDGLHQPSCINYSEEGFKEQFENALRKWGVPINHLSLINH